MLLFTITSTLLFTTLVVIIISINNNIKYKKLFTYLALIASIIGIVMATLVMISIDQIRITTYLLMLYFLIMLTLSGSKVWSMRANV